MANAKFSTGFKNALLDGVDMTTMFDSGTMDIYSGAQPSAADDDNGAGTLLAQIDIPANGFAASASGGVIAKGASAWTEASSIAAGTASWFRLRESSETDGTSTVHKRIDGDITDTGTGTGDLLISSTTIAITDPVTVDTFTITIA